MINRSKMRRQLYRGGGITGLYPRQGFGLGSKIKERIRKLIPNELADVAVKAAPFVAPFYPGAAALMRGIGRFDQRGSISDALKQGALTYGFGKGVGKLGGASGSELLNPGRQTYSMEGFKNEGIGKLFQGDKVVKNPNEEFLNTGKREGLGIVQKGVDFITSKAPMLKKLPDNVAQKLLVGGAISGASALASYFKGDFRPQEEGESMEDYLAARKDVVGKQMRIYMDNYFKFDPEYSQLDDAGRNAFVARYNVAQGGRIGLKHGTPEMGIKSLEAGAPDITYEGDMRMASAVTGGEERDIAGEMWMRLDKQTQSDYGSFENYFKSGDWIEGVKQIDPGMSRGPVLPEDPTKPINPFAPKPTGPVLPDKMMAAKGGRIGYRMGMGPAGLPGIPRQAPDGMEYDMRMNGGFQGLGAKEGKDDVPAMLAKNEFVFTADAVRGAGGGDIELGAQRMYDTMKNLERRVV